METMDVLALQDNNANRITLELLNNYSTRLELSYNYQHNAARVGYGKHRRLFFVAGIGRFHPRWMFKNEYGLQVGQLQFAGKGIGSLNVHGAKHQFMYERTTIVLYDESATHRLITCNLKALHIEVQRNEKEVESLHACLLFALGWSLEVQQQ